MSQSNVNTRFKDINDILNVIHLYALNSNEIYTIEQWAEKFSKPIENKSTYINKLFRHICFIDQKLMNYEKYRLKSLREWPKPYIDVKVLAANGFYFKEKPDSVQCNFCNVIIYKWESGDSATHQYSANCPLARGDKTKNIPIEYERTNKVI